MNTNWNYSKLSQITLKLFLALFLSMLFVPSMFAQKKARDLFINMPDSLNPILTAVNRADLVDFIESDMKAVVDNKFGKKSEMKALTDDYIRVDVSSKSSWQMKTLPLNDTIQVICAVSTVCAPACDSYIRFYDTDWNEISSDEFIQNKPVMADFLKTPTDEEGLNDFHEAIIPADIFLVEAILSPDKPELTYNWTTPVYMQKEAADKLTPYLSHPLVYRWVNGKFLPL